MKYGRCVNALDCYKKLRRDLSKNGDGVRNRKWLEWEASGDDQILEKTALITNCTFIGLGTEDRVEFDMLVADGE